METNKRTHIRMLFLLMAISLLSCEKDVILDLADTEGAYMIVESHIVNDGKAQWVRLSWSSSYYEVSSGEPVSGASVHIADETSSFGFEEWFPDSLPGYYFNDKIAQLLSETDYTLNISHDNKEFNASSKLNPVPLIDSVTLKLNPFSDLGINPDTVYDILAHFRDLPTEGNHYLFNLYVNDTLRTARPSDKALVSDENLEEYVSLAVLSINVDEVNPGDTLKLEIRSISKEMFDFYNVFFFQTDLSGNPFAGAPPANLPTNLSQGARGFFQVSLIHRKSVIFDLL